MQTRDASALRHPGLILAAILVAAALLRCVGLGALPLWMDETSSYWFSDHGHGHLWAEAPHYENHPPLYDMILKAWRSVVGATGSGLAALKWW